MKAPWPSFLAGMAALVLLSAGTPARSADPGVALGANLAGESCALGKPSPAASSGAVRSLPISCGGAESAGTLLITTLGRRLPGESQARREAVIAAAKLAPGGIGDAATMSCDDGQTLSPDSDSLLFLCTRTSNSWPRIAIVATSGDAVYQGIGVPALLPPLAEAFAAAAGRPLSPAEIQGARRILEARFPGAVLRASGADAANDAALIGLARLNEATRHFADAEAAYRRALEIEERLFGARAAAVGETLAELALQVSNQGRFEESASLFRRAEPIVNASPSAALRARFTSYLALDAANQRHYDDALKLAQKATEMRRAEISGSEGTSINGPSADGQIPASRMELAHSLRIEAMMAMRVGDLSSAIAAADEVLRIVNEDPGLPLWWRPDSVAMMAEINARLGRVVEAERQYRQALVMYEKLFGDTAPTAFAELKLGQFYDDQELYPAAVAVFRQALAILGRDEAARSGIVSDQIAPFLAAASALAERDPKESAALQAEMFKASQLIGSDVASRTIAAAAGRLAAGNATLAALIHSAEDAQRQRDSARIELAAETAKADDERDAARERKLAADTREAGAKADDLLAQIRRGFPDYAKFADPGPAELDELKASLGLREAFLSFVIGQKSSFALLVTPQGLTVRPIAATVDSLAADVTALRAAFVPRLGALADFDLDAASALYRKLFGPIEKELAATDHLIVAPSGALASLPFSLLVVDPPRRDARRRYDQAAWLVRRLALSQVPSARAFLSLRVEAQHRVAAPKPFLAVADPSFAGSAGSKALADLARRCDDRGPIPGELLRAMPPLHETATEVKTIGRLLGAGDDALLLGKDATESGLRARQLDQYGVLYFATHGLLPGELQCQAEPGLVLSPPSAVAHTTEEDGLLQASEIAQLKLNADLVVLSACNTAASGGQFGGEALAGLSDAFFGAGARTVLASHWEVPSLATVKLMTGVFDRLGRDRRNGVAQALRGAQLALVAQPETAHPFYWAAFSVIGDGAAAAASKPLSQSERGGRS